MRVRQAVLLLGLIAAHVAAPAHAVETNSVWSRAGAPLAADGTFMPPPSLEDVAPELLDIYARHGRDFTRGGIFDEVRLGVLGFWQDGASSVEGVYVTGQVLFDPFVAPFDNWFLDVLLRPRPHLGGTVSLDGPDQLFAGLTWTAPIGRTFFAEASFGGTIHNGSLSGAQVSLGCRVLFRESLGVGANIGARWSVLVGIDHSSHAGLCSGDNDGLTHVGGYLGYRF